MKRISLATTLVGLVLLPGCGSGENTLGQPSADQRKALDNVARKLDEQGTIDTSPDSMVPADEGAVTGNGAAPVPTPLPANNANAAAPR